MKFAKKLQEELEQAWDGQYLDYKALKKVMKVSDQDQVMQSFCDALDTELNKVRVYMRHQQEELQEIPGLLLEETSPRGRSPTRGVQGCTDVVRKIESFRHYSDLNFEAMRKIIKKFDKRFHCRFQEVIGLPDTAQQLVTAEDISVRLLKPAHECLRQIRSYRPSTINQVERPLLQLRQFTFWVRELQNGIELLGVHIGGTGEDLSTCVKNTFIDVSEHESPLRRSRAKSWDCTRVQVACPGDVPPSSDEDGQEGPSDSKPKNCSGSERRSEPRRAKEHSGSQKWWGELSDNCAISGFPIAHLPYPPFKLQMGKGKGHKFVDGQFLMLQILSSFNFESLGRPLTQAEVQALDQHIKKCKLSPLRVSRGLELLCLVSQGNLRARQEMAELRAKAAKKLGALKHIQRARLQRGDCQAIPALPGKLEARRPAKS